ncbi:MAG: GAF domain-containing sensor histidine kinase, partial [Cyanobacteria bacterium J06623_5]
GDVAPIFWAKLSEHREAFILQDVPNTLSPGPDVWEPSIAWHLQRGHTDLICAPLLLGDETIGFMGLGFVGKTQITPEALELAQALTNQATLAIHLTRLAEQAKSTALSVAVTEERTRLAREIHDTLAQAFTGVSLQLEATKGILESQPKTARTYINRAGKLARQGLSEARRSVRALRSQALETDTLANALQVSLQEMTQESTLKTEFRVVGTPITLPENIQTNLLRIGQEAITNVLRHANANRLVVVLTFTDSSVKIKIRDDGNGSAITSLNEVEGFGLLGMRERAIKFGGQFAFNSTPGEGTVIKVAIPL